MDIEQAVKAALDQVVKDLETSAVKDVEMAVTDWAREWVHDHRPATHAVLIVSPTQGEQMPGSITVDTANETVTIEFVDDRGDTNAAPPVSPDGNPIVVTFTSDNTAVVTVATDASNPLMGDITPVAEGTANIGATLANDDGSPVLEADGVTPFPTPATVAVTVGPGAAVGDSLVLSV